MFVMQIAILLGFQGMVEIDFFINMFHRQALEVQLIHQLHRLPQTLHHPFAQDHP
jgi:hypothetical protein